jgi:succinylglutamate desuccinylase
LTAQGRKRERGSKKVKVRFVTSRDLHAQFDQDDAERRERAEATAQRQKQKEADAAEQDQQVVEDGMNRIFIGRLSSYKKGDLRALAVALALSDKGTNAELMSQIKAHLDQHLELQSNQRFSGLFPKQNRPTQETNVLINAAAALLPTTYSKHLIRSVQWSCVD